MAKEWTWSKWVATGQPRIVEHKCHTCGGDVFKFEPHWHVERPEMDCG